MSSFIIDKTELIKAAGLVHGIAASSRYGNKYFCRDVAKHFTDVHRWNVISYNLQYGECISEDTNEYEDVFAEYSEIGRQIYAGRHRMSQAELRVALSKFFDSVLYQIEDKEMNTKAAAWFYRCMSVLFERDSYSLDGCWGDLDLIK
jgi:hypothetical protein